MKINVAYSCDEMYIPHTGISMLSLLENNKHFDDITFYFIEKDVTQGSLDKLSELVTSYNREFRSISFYDLCADLKINTLGRHIETVYVKLFFQRLEGVEKILYIDSDTIINASLTSFWEIDLGRNLVAGVETYTGDKSALGLNSEDRLMNDGVALLNLTEFRKNNIEKEFIECIASYDGNPPVLSEGVINKVCRGKLKIIHPKYNLLSGLISLKNTGGAGLENYYRKEQIKDAIANPVIIHYLSAFFNRPWDINCTHPLKDKYLYYKSISFWKDLPLHDKKMSKRLRIIGLLQTYLPGSMFQYLREFLKK
jgi:lipopolysaccharide biosynthesis glycosyltransferase